MRAERANLFVVPLDAQRRWYRLHGLFADYLRARVPPAERGDLHRVAARLAGGGGDAARCRRARDRRRRRGRGGAAHRPRGAGRLRGGRARHRCGAGSSCCRCGHRSRTPTSWCCDAWTRFYGGRMAEAAGRRRAPSCNDAGEGSGRGTSARARGPCSRRRRAPGRRSLAREGIALLDGDPLFESVGLQAAGLAQLARGDVAASLGTLRDAFARALARRASDGGPAGRQPPGPRSRGNGAP